MENIKLTEQQINNLLLFLDRVELKGSQEALALVEILSALSNPEKDNQGTTSVVGNKPETKD